MKHATVHEIPISVGSVDAVRAFRLAAEAAGWRVVRHEGKRPVHRMALIIPLQQSARTFGILIDDGPLEGAAMQAAKEGLNIHSISSRNIKQTE